MSCAFCEIPSIRKREIARNELAWAFPTNMPIVPGHILVAPIRCVATVDEMTADELRAVFDLREQLKKVLIQVFGAQGFNYAWNESRFAGQSVPHFHLHILPRKAGDTGILEYEPRKFLYRPGERETSPDEELLAVSALLKESL